MRAGYPPVTRTTRPAVPSTASRTSTTGTCSTVTRPRRGAPTGSSSPRTSTCSRPPAGCPTCTSSGSTGSTCRRCSRPRPGSEHGYDVAVHTREDPERGGATGLEALSAVAHGLDMGVLVDIVPNHVGVAAPAAGHLVVGRARAAGRRRGTRRTSTSTGRPAAGGCCCRCVGDDDEAAVEVAARGARGALPRPAAPDGARHDHPRGAALRARRRGAGATPSSTTGASSRSRRWPACGSRTPRSSRPRTREIGRWFDVGLVDGLRVDHPDGLRDPGGYLDRLAGLTGGAYVLVEKILEPGESLPASWATAGTTGYDVLALVDRVLTDPAGEAVLDKRLRTGRLRRADPRRPSERSPTRSLQAEVRRIVRELARWLRTALEPVDPVLEDAVAELLACFPVYRSYLPLGLEHLVQAFATARGQPSRPAVHLRRPGAGALRPGPARRAAVPADQRDGDGQGRRGLRLLPLLAAHLAQRGRRRPVGVRDRRRRVPRRR